MDVPKLVSHHSLLQFNCFLLMPVVDKLPALLREDLDSAFEDVDNVFDITSLRHSLSKNKRETEIELKRVYAFIFSFLILNPFPSISFFP